MKSNILRLVAFSIVGCLVAGTLLAQRPPVRTMPGRGPNNGNNNGNNNNKPTVKLPDDPRLLQIHKNFVDSAEKLAGEYVLSNKLDKAQSCYEEILRLVPGYSEAQTKLDEVKMKQAGKEKKAINVMANEDWQPTGVYLIEGKPVIITAEGEWKFKMSYDLSAEGMEIPKELRDFNLGALIGRVATTDPKDSKPFFIGARKEFNAEKSGQLFLRIYDSEVNDNVGKLSVMITGTFEHKK